jgi:hypothetical protein
LLEVRRGGVDAQKMKDTKTPSEPVVVNQTLLEARRGGLTLKNESGQNYNFNPGRSSCNYVAI